MEEGRKIQSRGLSVIILHTTIMTNMEHLTGIILFTLRTILPLLDHRRYRILHITRRLHYTRRPHRIVIVEIRSTFTSNPRSMNPQSTTLEPSPVRRTSSSVVLPTCIPLRVRAMSQWNMDHKFNKTSIICPLVLDPIHSHSSLITRSSQHLQSKSMNRRIIYRRSATKNQLNINRHQSRWQIQKSIETTSKLSRKLEPRKRTSQLWIRSE